MAENLWVNKLLSKNEQYESLLPQIESLIGSETNSVANMANAAAALKQAFNWLWVGFYVVDNNQLVLGPFQGPVACTRIAFGKGVCGTAWLQQQTILVENVNLFPGHIACSSESQSEIVVPIIRNGHVIGVLDVDSEHLAYFDQTDVTYLEKLCNYLAPLI
jgi:L-methionine (R)-S-oxide reductase